MWFWKVIRREHDHVINEEMMGYKTAYIVLINSHSFPGVWGSPLARLGPLTREGTHPDMFPQIVIGKTRLPEIS